MATAKNAAKSRTAKKKPATKKKTLVIVESPAKAKTIEKYLGSSYTVKASMGHLIDLPKSRMAINVENNFEPEYITVRGRAKLLQELQKAAGNSAAVLLASDNDREGEAIAWHLHNAITQKNTGLSVSRISFNEITPQAIKEAIEKPSSIDDAKVNAQKARRVLDRLVGYNLSPLLWKKVKSGLSAGRVQSVALRLICEREKEVEAFVPEEYWSLDAEFRKQRKVFSAALINWNGEKANLKTEAEVNSIIEVLKGEEFKVTEIREVDKTVRPKPPFTTSMLQQTAANRLGWVSKKTMQVAQRLYEGVNVGKSRVGLITYMRTDSVRISNVALAEARSFISKTYPECLPEKPNFYSTSKTAQDAHEAIRPTYPSYTPEYVKPFLAKDEERLYSLIWERFISSQMKPAKTKTLSADISAGKALFRAAGTQVVEQGFFKALFLLAGKDERGGAFPPVSEGETLESPNFKSEQHWTQGPPRFTDATIVKTLEEKGIGRPSTYAPTISLLMDRYYVQRSNKQLVPTTLGKCICDMLVENFGDVVDTDFTASMETLLDEVEEKGREWADMIRMFYTPFKAKVDMVSQTLESQKGSFDEVTNEVCDKCGKPMLKKLGRFGYFLACSGFPACRNAKSIPVAKCPKCGGDVVERKSKKGRRKKFYGCAKYPECDFLTQFKPTAQNCPKCGWFLVEKSDKRSGRHKACINPDCSESK
ncbi:MAG: type I DNA topoisomerase [Spirochaetaceae bacterium]|nr:type I DNA topoisomerase [Spirochaetaceae bacterium]